MLKKKKKEVIQSHFCYEKKPILLSMNLSYKYEFYEDGL